MSPRNPGNHRRVYDDSAHQVAHIRGLATSEGKTHPVLLQVADKGSRATDEFSDDLLGDVGLVPPNGAREKDIVHDTYAEQVVEVHDNGILRNALPDAKVSSSLPIHVGQRGLRACAVGMHHQCLRFITRDGIGNDLAERSGEEALVHVFDGGVHVTLVGRDAAHVIPRSIRASTPGSQCLSCSVGILGLGTHAAPIPLYLGVDGCLPDGLGQRLPLAVCHDSSMQAGHRVVYADRS
mmetsp:Transcript_9554/g.21308  ORF Transcript_9554/g.21308 Transcript_9554/m.21308 type:complete len:237 (+) Transcript_9554:1245-1955(+)